MTESALHAGAAEIDITPPMGVQMCGYGPYEKRTCTEVLDPLAARALWLQTPDAAAAIVALDLCTIDAALRGRIVAELSSRCGLEDASVFVAASHTHSGPAAQRMIGWGEPDAGYLDGLPGRIAEAVVAARDAAGPAVVAAARCRIRDVGVNREQPDLGPTDTAAQVMRFDRADGRTLAAVVNFGAHAVVRYPFTSRISADWPGRACDAVREAFGGAAPLFLQGACGNINGDAMTFDRTDPPAHQAVCDARVAATAERFAGQIIPVLRRMAPAPTATLRTAWHTVALPCVRPDEAELNRTIADNGPAAESMRLEDLRPLHERIADETDAEIAFRRARFEVDSCRRQLALLESGTRQIEAPIHLLQVGGAAIVGWPGEVFVELGLELRQRSPFPLTFVAAPANDTVGYVPTPAAYESQGRPNAFGQYPVAVTPRIYGRLPFRADVGTILVERTVEMLNDFRAV